MIFNGICETMTSDALRLPEKGNLKVYMRHSIRYDNPPDGDYSKLLLTPEGIEIANRIGRELDRPIGYTYSSPVARCMQTVTEICRGAGIMDPDIKSDRGLVHLEGLGRAQSEFGIGWYDFFYGLQNNMPELTAGISLVEAARPIIDTIFAVPESDDSLDVIVSHDSHVVTLASALFDLKTGRHGENWCGYTEGLFFYGNRKDFTALWRGEERHFVNWEI
ncbi:MAG: histidine phosphatase family protein [Lachnospiraceae bacterium]|nr:histidine phosphatase family protein [Lachnospiraceae bacterium]